MSFLTHNELRITHHTLINPRLPLAFTQKQGRCRIVHISDLHFYEFTDPDYFERVKAEVRALDPDILLMTGDVVHYGDTYLEDAGAFLSNLRARYGQYAVLGNHDYKDGSHGGFVTGMLAQAGFHLLKNTRTPIVHPDVGRLWLTGLDDFKYGRPDVPATLGGLTHPEEPVLLLGHNPRLIGPVQRFLRKNPDVQVDLMVAGHTHAGHVYLPPLYLVYRYGMKMKYRYGLYQTPETTLYVTSGVGSAAFYIRTPFYRTGFPRFRYNTYPEIAVLDWVKAG